MDPTAPLISLRPNEALRQIAQTLNGHVDDWNLHLPVLSTCSETLRTLQASLTTRDRALFLIPARSRAQKEALRRSARQEFSQAASSSRAHALQVRNTTPAAQLSPPTRPSPQIQSKLRQNFPSDEFRREPHMTARATTREDDNRLACVPAFLKLSAIDGDERSQIFDVRVEDCLFDTGCDTSIITDDLISPGFMAQDVHDAYRFKDRVGVQVSATLSFSGSAFQLDGIFEVRPAAAVPNCRHGVILGQKAFIDAMVYRSVPRSILIAQGEEVGEKYWGDIVVEMYVDADGDLHQL